MIANKCLYIIDTMVEWVIDLGDSFHITLNTRIFTTYKVRDFSLVKIENSSCCKIIGIKDVRIENNVGYQLTLKDVRYVLELCLNLISVNALKE